MLWITVKVLISTFINYKTWNLRIIQPKVYLTYLFSIMATANEVLDAYLILLRIKIIDKPTDYKNTRYDILVWKVRPLRWSENLYKVTVTYEYFNSTSDQFECVKNAISSILYKLMNTPINHRHQSCMLEHRILNSSNKEIF